MEDAIERMKDMITSMEVAMLATCDKHGAIWSRPMYTVQVDDKMGVWFFTNKNAPKVQDLKEDSSVNISYADFRNHTYLSLTGKAKMIDDPELKDQLWDPILENWFPAGNSDRDVQLLKVTVEGAEYWDSETSEMINLWNKQDSTSQKVDR
jgi:general stress protein 26